MRRFRSSLLSSFGDFVVTRPSTAILSAPRCRNGSNESARGVSYSRKKPSAGISPKLISATGS